MSDMRFSLLDWGVLCGYMLLMVVVGVLVARRQKDVEGFFLGGRSMPAWAVSLSVLATSLSAATFIGAPQIAYAGDMTYLSTNIGTILAAFIVALFFVPPLYRAGTVTLYGFLTQRFGPGATLAASCMFLLGRLLASGARLFMAGIGFALILYGDYAPPDLLIAIIILGAIGTAYTVCGGIRAVIWTDAIQIFVVGATALLSVLLLLRMIPLTPNEIVETLRTAETGDKLRLVDWRFSFAEPFTFWAAFVAMTVVGMSTYGVDHDLAQRVMTARSPLRGGLALVGSMILGLPLVGLFLVIGLLLHIYYARPDLMGVDAPWDAIADSKRVYPQFLLNHMPIGLRGLSMAGLFAAAMSSFDSAINAMASVAVADIYLPLRKQWRGGEVSNELALSRWMVVGMGILLTLFAVLAVFLQQAGNETLISFSLGVMAFALAPLLGVFSAALFTRRGNTRSVWTALGIGMLSVLLLQPYAAPAWLDIPLAWPWWWVIVSPLSFLICILGCPQAPSEKTITQKDAPR